MNLQELADAGYPFLAQSLGLAIEPPNYFEYINSPEWKARAEKAKERAGHRCQVCNSPDSLHAHHRTYEHLGDEDPMDITVLCDKCHALFHRGGQLMPEWW